MATASILPVQNNISQAGTYLDESTRQVNEGYARTDAGTSQRRLTEGFQRQLPQLQSRIGAAGQFYSSARKDAEGQVSKNYLESSFDIQNALQRQLDDFTRQRLYASVGLIPV